MPPKPTKGKAPVVQGQPFAYSTRATPPTIALVAPHKRLSHCAVASGGIYASLGSDGIVFFPRRSSKATDLPSTSTGRLLNEPTLRHVNGKSISLGEVTQPQHFVATSSASVSIVVLVSPAGVHALSTISVEAEQNGRPGTAPPTEPLEPLTAVGHPDTHVVIDAAAGSRHLVLSALNRATKRVEVFGIGDATSGALGEESSFIPTVRLLPDFSIQNFLRVWAGPETTFLANDSGLWGVGLLNPQVAWPNPALLVPLGGASSVLSVAAMQQPGSAYVLTSNRRILVVEAAPVSRVTLPGAEGTEIAWTVRDVTGDLFPRPAAASKQTVVAPSGGGDAGLEATLSAMQTVTAQQLGHVPPLVTLCAGNSHVVAMAADGSCWGWGANSFGQLGPSTALAGVFTRVAIPLDFSNATLAGTSRVLRLSSPLDTPAGPTLNFGAAATPNSAPTRKLPTSTLTLHAPNFNGACGGVATVRAAPWGTVAVCGDGTVRVLGQY